MQQDDAAPHAMTLQVLGEIEALHARVERLEGVYQDLKDAAAKAAARAKAAVESAAHKAASLVHGKPNKELRQKDVIDALHSADEGAQHEQGGDFTFTVSGTPYSLHWNEGGTPAFEVTGGSLVRQPVQDLRALHQWLQTLRATHAAAPADLHRYTEAVLRQQRRPRA